MAVSAVNLNKKRVSLFELKVHPKKEILLEAFYSLDLD